MRGGAQEPAPSQAQGNSALRGQEPTPGVLLFPEPGSPPTRRSPDPLPAPGMKLPAVLCGPHCLDVPARQAGPEPRLPPARTGPRAHDSPGGLGTELGCGGSTFSATGCATRCAACRAACVRRGDRLGWWPWGTEGEAQTRAESASAVQVRVFMWTTQGNCPRAHGSCSRRDLPIGHLFVSGGSQIIFKNYYYFFLKVHFGDRSERSGFLW